MFKSRLLTAAAIVLLATTAFGASGPLSLVPADAVSVGVVKLSDIRTGPLGGMLFRHTDHMSSNGEGDRFLADAGLDPKKDVDVLTVAMSPKTALGSDGEVLVLAEGRFNVERLTAALTERGATRKTTPGGSYLTMPKSDDETHRSDGAVAFPDARLAILGSETAVVEALAARANGGTGFAERSLLGHDLHRIDRNATAWALVDVTRAARLTGSARMKGGNQQREALSAAINNISIIGLWATDSGNALALGGFGLADDTETLQLLEDTLRGALSAMRLAVKDKSPDMVSVLRRFNVGRTAEAVTISGSIPAESLRKLMAQKHASQH